MEQLYNIIKNKNVVIMSHGKSIEELEERIDEFKDYDIVWTSLNQFTIVEDFILSKIGKRLSIVLDCSSVADSRIRLFEYKLRMPRLCEFLSRSENNIWVTTKGIIHLYHRFLNEGDFIRNYRHKIFLVDEIFPRSKIGYFMSVPNSITLLIALFVQAQAKNIIMFGFDGYTGGLEEGINFCYKPRHQALERTIALGTLMDNGINRGTIAFESNFCRIFKEYKTMFNSKTNIINCSPNTYYTCIEKVNYDEVKKWLI